MKPASAAVLALVLVGLVTLGSVRASTPASAGTDPDAWTVYHGDPAGTGVATGVVSVDTSTPAWTSPALDGELYGESLVLSGRVYVATEDDTVYALSATTGAVVWSTHLATPVPSSSLPCGDIAPTVGITGTPVIDPARSEIFVVADEETNGKPAHVLVGLNLATGATELTQDVDPAGADPAALLQRTGLTLSAGQVIFGLGGNDGDCATYRGRVVAVNEAGSSPTFFTVDAAPGDSQGAIWMGGGAPAVDASGNIWVSAGNGSVYSAADPYDDSDSTLELSSSLSLSQYFAPSSWPANNSRDLDMSTVPALLADGQVVQAGKSRIVYLLNGTSLGGIGHELASLPAACSQDIDGGSAEVGTTVYLPCLSGPVAVQTTQSPPSLHILWSAASGGGPPIVAAGRVWTIGQNGVLYGLNAATGQVQQQATIGVPANHFPTPSAGDGLLLAPSANRVVAFAATSTASTSTASTTTSTTSSGTTSSSAGAPPSSVAQSAPAHTSGSGTDWGLVLTIAGIALVLIGLVVMVVRRPRSGRAAPPPAD